MTELNFLLRIQAPGDKEFKATKVNTYGSPTLFTTQLTGGHTRKKFQAYNNSGIASGEVLWGNSDCDVNGMVIPKGALVEIPIAGSLASDGETGGVDVYFCNTVSGEVGELRVLEIS